MIAKKPIAGDKLKFSDGKAQQDVVQDFKTVFTNLKKLYRNTPSEMSQRIVDEVVFDEDGSDGSSVLSDEQIFEENLLVERTRSIFEEMEGTMEEYSDEILQDIEDAAYLDNPFPDTEDGTSFYDHVVFITDRISNMDWFKEEAWSIPGRRPSEEVYEQELGIIDRARKEIIEREKKATSGRQIKVYSTLKVYLDYKEVSLKSYFEKKINEPRLVKIYKKVLKTKVGRLVLYKTIKWLQKKFPKALVGGIVGVIATAAGVYQVVESSRHY